jgi:FkbM family methyltransferase
MWERYQRAQPPESFEVPAIDVRSSGNVEQGVDDLACHEVAVPRSSTGLSEAVSSIHRAEATLAETLNLGLSNGTVLALRPSLEEMSTYVLLEQETWFEKELAFLPYVLKPGMRAIDIGANVGIYSLAMARLVAPGSVYAYEPGAEPRRLLERSRDLNHASNLEIFPMALSDSERDGHLAHGASSELSTLAEDGAGERVAITTLDAEEMRLQWSPPDFVKIDAEGEEERILAGGRSFFIRHSPLVMFEIRSGDEVSGSLQSVFPMLGYGLYRLLTGLPVLVPIESGEHVDHGELNILAAKPERAAMLAQAGLLIESKVDWRPSPNSRCEPLSLLMAQGFASALKPVWESGGTIDPDYCEALAAYEVWRRPDVPLPQRCAALDYAFRQMCTLCERAANFARLSTLARMAWEAGKRGVCARALRDFIGELERRTLQFSEPFWPACPRFDALPPGGQAGAWFVASVIEQHERVRAFSSYFEDDSSGLDWLCQQSFASVEMERRRVLIAARNQRKVEVSERLHIETSDHLNAEVWRLGSIL